MTAGELGQRMSNRELVERMALDMTHEAERVRAEQRASKKR